MNDMVDMSRFVEAKSDQLNSDDLIGGARTITITKVTGNDGDQPVSIFYTGDSGKPFKPCKTVRRILIGVWGRYANEYVGKSMTIYRDDSVTFGGLATGGIRVSHMSGIEKDTVVVVMKSKGKKAGVKIQPLRVEQRQSGGEQAKPATPTQTPAEWTDAYIKRVEAASDIAALTEVQRKAAKGLDRLKAEHSDLHKRAVDAGTKRAAELAPETGSQTAADDDSDPFGEGD